MAYQSLFYYTDLPKGVVDILEQDLTHFNPELGKSSIGSGTGTVDTKIRNSETAWVNDEHWIGGFVWHYIQKANRENFLFDIDCIDGNSLQYTSYGEGQHYTWHVDADVTASYKPQAANNRFDISAAASDLVNVSCEKIRKISFSLLLSDPEEYEGGNFQLMDEAGRSHFAPRHRGVVVVFDSRARHRVTKVTKGVRRSIVGWAVGPRWR